MTPIHTARDEFRSNDLVRLVDRDGDILSGTRGRILGHVASEKPTYVVSFEGDRVRVLSDVRVEDDSRRNVTSDT